MNNIPFIFSVFCWLIEADFGMKFFSNLAFLLFVKATILIVGKFRHRVANSPTNNEALLLVGDDAVITANPAKMGTDDSKKAEEEFDEKLSKLKKDEEKVKLISDSGQKIPGICN